MAGFLTLTGAAGLSGSRLKYQVQIQDAGRQDAGEHGCKIFSNAEARCVSLYGLDDSVPVINQIGVEIAVLSENAGTGL